MNPKQAQKTNNACKEILEENPYKKLIVVPKHEKAFDILDNEVVLGYPNGYSEFKPEDYSNLSDWRNRDIHILGRNPVSQYETIQELTQPTLTGEQPANITGVDWNGPHLGALKGQYWSPDKWKDADEFTIRETVEKSLQEIRKYWEEKDLWPETTPLDLYGDPTLEPADPVYATTGEDIQTLEKLEDSIISTHSQYGDLAFQSKAEKHFFETREQGVLEDKTT